MFLTGFEYIFIRNTCIFLKEVYSMPFPYFSQGIRFIRARTKIRKKKGSPCITQIERRSLFSRECARSSNIMQDVN